MNNNIILFTPKSEIEANINVEDFISFVETLSPINERMDYASHYWKGAVNFTKLGVSSKNRSESNLLHYTIMRFAKAYLLYSQTHNRAKAFNEMKAIRAIEHVMVNMFGSAEITRVNGNILNQAATQIEISYDSDAAYHAGCHLVKLKDFLENTKIIKPFKWKNPITRGEDVKEKVGEIGEAHRLKKLPDENALLAIAEIFSYGLKDLSPKDIFTSSSIAILLAAPARASELFYLKKDCIHEDTDRSGNKAIGLKWYSGKGYGYEVEWIPNSMENIVREAVKRLTDLTNPSRDYAKRLESDSSNISKLKNASSFPYIKYDTGSDVRVKWSEALFTMFLYQMNNVRSTDIHNLWIPSIGTLSEDLSTTKKLNKLGEKVNIKSIFERHNYPSYSIKTHQIRHLLTSIAKINGMETELLTKWSGRADVKHNRVYNHTTPEQYNDTLAKISRNKISENTSLFSIEVFKPSSIQEINTNTSLTLHQTEFGVCIQSYITSPCTKHRNCITCSEQVCIKGEDIKLKRLKKRLAMDESILEADNLAIKDGSYGADRHYNQRLDTIKICKELIEKLSDESLPEGTLIKVSSEKNMCNLDRALEINNKKLLPKIEKNISKGTLINRPNKSLRMLEILRSS